MIPSFIWGVMMRFLAILLCGLSVPAVAVTVSLDPTTLPSAQGWTYITTNLAETVAFAPATDANGRAILRQRTTNETATGFGVSTISYYERALGAIAPGQRFELTVEYQPYRGFGTNNFGFGFQLALDGWSYFLGVNDFGPGYVNALGQQVQRSLPGAFGPKPVVMELSGQNGVFSVRANGKPFFTDVVAWKPGFANALSFGDYTNNANAFGAWYRIDLTVGPAAVAEPAVAALFGLGALALVRRRRA